MNLSKIRASFRQKVEALKKIDDMRQKCELSSMIDETLEFNEMLSSREYTLMRELNKLLEDDINGKEERK